MSHRVPLLRHNQRASLEHDRLIFWRAGDQMLCVGYPQDGNPATVGNGVLVALRATSREQVDRLRAIVLG